MSTLKNLVLISLSFMSVTLVMANDYSQTAVDAVVCSTPNYVACNCTIPDSPSDHSYIALVRCDDSKIVEDRLLPRPFATIKGCQSLIRTFSECN